MIIKLTWRNVWRNRRRTLITMASVFFAVILSTLMMSLKEGVYSGMIDSAIGSYIGYGQVHAKGYWDDRSLDNSFEFNKKLSAQINNTPGITNNLQRVEAVAMAASTDITKVVMVVGLNAEDEKKVNKLDERVVAGEYLKPDDKAVMLGAGLAEYLHLKVNDTLVLLGQGYHGSSSAGKYPVKALIKFGSPELSKQLVILPLKEAQWLYSMEGLINNLILHFEEPANSKAVLKELQHTLGDQYEVMHWKEIMPELDNLIKTDRMEGYIFMFILYMVVSFGILGTILMMLAERTREFGMLVSLGMKRLKLSIIVWFEVVLISLVGAVLGMAGAYPICYYFFIHPISLGEEVAKISEEYGMEGVMRASIESFVFLEQGLVILAIGCLIALYPFIKLGRLDAINAMRK